MELLLKYLFENVQNKILTQDSMVQKYYCGGPLLVVYKILRANFE